MTDGERHRRFGRAAGTTSRRHRYRLLTAAGLLLVAAAVAWQVNATLWTTHSERVGTALVHQFEKKQRQAKAEQSGSQGALDASQAALGLCGSTSAGGVRGLLVIPSIGLTAPVEHGVGDDVLDVAVGLLPGSALPGARGNAVLEAHDVSYFVNISKLVPGAVVRYETPCTTYTFTVQSHGVVAQGSPIYDTPAPTLTLVTCWPTNALWFTTQRYIVSASEVSSASTGGATLTYRVGPAAPTVPAPAALVSEGLTLTTNSIPMGQLALAGTPDPEWAQSTGPLLDQSAGVAGFIAGIKSLTQDQTAWWAAVAPGVTAPAPLVGAPAPGYLSPLEVTVSATGATATGITLSATVTISGGHTPGRYAMTVAEAITGSTLVISSWTLHAA